MTSVEHYQGLTDDLATETAAAVLTVYTAWQTATVGPDVAVAAIASVIATANAAAATLADLFVAGQIEAQTRVPQPPTGIAPRDDTERLTKAVATILDIPEAGAPEVAAGATDAGVPDGAAADALAAADAAAADAQGVADAETAERAVAEDMAAVDAEVEEAMRLERLARSEPLETGQAVTADIIDKLPVVSGWTRALDADPCERCQRWAEDGRVFPKGQHFKRHYGCNCQMQIVTTPTERTAP